MRNHPHRADTPATAATSMEIEGMSRKVGLAQTELYSHTQGWDGVGQVDVYSSATTEYKYSVAFHRLVSSCCWRYYNRSLQLASSQGSKPLTPLYPQWRPSTLLLWIRESSQESQALTRELNSAVQTEEE